MNIAFNIFIMSTLFFIFGYLTPISLARIGSNLLVSAYYAVKQELPQRERTSSF